jgi:hypothetical protein
LREQKKLTQQKFGIEETEKVRLSKHLSLREQKKLTQQELDIEETEKAKLIRSLTS